MRETFPIDPTTINRSEESKFDNNPSKALGLENLELTEAEREKVENYKTSLKHLLDSQNWPEIQKASEKIFAQEEELLSKSDLAVELHDLLYSAPVPDEPLDYTDEQKIRTTIRYLVAAMEFNPHSIQYLSGIIRSGNFPTIGIKVFEDALDETDDLPEFHYATEIALTLKSIGTKEAAEVAQEMLQWMDRVRYGADYESIRTRTIPISTHAVEEEVIGTDTGGGEWVVGGESEYDRLLTKFQDNDKYPEQIFYDRNNPQEHILREVLLEILTDQPLPSSIPKVVEALKLQDAAAPSYFSQVIKVFETNGKLAAAQELINLAKSDDLLDKKIALTLLYRLESNMIPVDKDGVEFLGKHFDLGNYNTPDYYIQRVTGNGDIGVFKKDSQLLQKYFSLEGIDDEQQQLQAELLELTYKSFLLAPAETEEEKATQQQFLEQFAEKYLSYFDTELLAGSGVSFRDLSFSEQAALIAAVDNSEAENTAALVKQLATEYGLHGVKTLLAIAPENVGVMITKIIEFGGADNENPAKLKDLFSKYAFMIDSGNEVEAFLQNHHQQEVAADPELAYKVKRNILHRSSIVMDATLQDLSIESLQRARQQMASLERNSLLAAQSMKEFLLSGEKLETLSGVTMEELSGPEIDTESQKQMLDLYQANWENKTTLEYWRHLKDKFISSLAAQNARFNILKVDNKIIAFARFTAEASSEEKFLHAGAFNVDFSFQGGKIGEMFLSQALQAKIAEGYPIHAETNPNNPMLKKYKSMGFAEIGQTEYLGEPEVKLVLTPSSKSRTKTAAN
ncbi:MAG TPA: GNAT family N-acetyltransferase [Candidatus Doudnabacteria bacterium]|nr:GNAT family N-acetyltransferase [Candidatus Doudnabacteria bacterium]